MYIYKYEYSIETGFYSSLTSMTGFPLKNARRYRIFGQIFSDAFAIIYLQQTVIHVKEPED